VYANDNFYLWTSSKFFHPDLVQHLMEYTEKNMPFYLRNQQIYYQGDVSYSDRRVFELLQSVKPAEYQEFIFNEFINYLEVQISTDPLLPIRFWFDENFRMQMWYDFIWQHLHFVLFQSPNNTLLAGIVSNHHQSDSLWFSYPNVNEISYSFERWGYSFTKISFDFWVLCYDLIIERFFSHVFYESAFGRAFSPGAVYPTHAIWDSTVFFGQLSAWNAILLFFVACLTCVFYYRPFQYDLLDHIAYGIQDTYSSTDEEDEDEQEKIELPSVDEDEDPYFSSDIPRKSITRIKLWIYENTGIDLLGNEGNDLADDETEPLVIFFLFFLLSMPVYMMRIYHPMRKNVYHKGEMLLTHYDYDCFLFHERKRLLGGTPAKDIFFTLQQQEISPVLITANRWHNSNLDKPPELLQGPVIYNYDYFFGHAVSLFDYDQLHVWYADAYCDELLARSLIDDEDLFEEELASLDPDEDLEFQIDEIATLYVQQTFMSKLEYLAQANNFPRPQDAWRTAKHILLDLRDDQLKNAQDKVSSVYYDNPLKALSPQLEKPHWELNTYASWLQTMEKEIMGPAVPGDERRWVPAIRYRPFREAERPIVTEVPDPLQYRDTENPLKYQPSWTVETLRSLGLSGLADDFMSDEQLAFSIEHRLKIEEVKDPEYVPLDLEKDDDYLENYVVKIGLGHSKPPLFHVEPHAYDELFNPVKDYYREIPEPPYTKTAIIIERNLWRSILVEYSHWNSKAPDLFQVVDVEDPDFQLKNIEDAYSYLDYYLLSEYMKQEDQTLLDYVEGEDLEEEGFSEFLDGFDWTFSSFFYNEDDDEDDEDSFNDLLDESFAGNKMSVFHRGLKDVNYDFLAEEYTAQDLEVPIFTDAQYSVFDDDEEDEFLSWNDEEFREAAPRETTDPESDFWDEMEPIWPEETLQVGEMDVVTQAREYLSDQPPEIFFKEIWSWMQAEWYYEFVDIEEMEAEGFGLVPDDYSIEEEAVEIFPIDVAVGDAPLWVKEMIVKPDFFTDSVRPMSFKGLDGKTTSFFLLDNEDPVIHEDLDEALAVLAISHEWHEEVASRLQEDGWREMAPVFIDPLLIWEYSKYKYSTAPHIFSFYDYSSARPEYMVQRFNKVDWGTMAEGVDLLVVDPDDEDEEPEVEKVTETVSEPVKPVKPLFDTQINLYNEGYSDFSLVEDSILVGEFYRMFTNTLEGPKLTEIGKLGYTRQFSLSGFFGMTLDSWMDVVPEGQLEVFTGISPMSLEDELFDELQISHALLSAEELSYIAQLKKVNPVKPFFSKVPDFESELDKPHLVETPDEDFLKVFTPEICQDNFPLMQLWEFYNPVLGRMTEEEQKKQSEYSAYIPDMMFVETMLNDSIVELPYELMYTDPFDEMKWREAILEDYNENEIEWLPDGQLRNEGEHCFEDDDVDLEEYDLDIEDDDEDDDDEDLDNAQINEISRVTAGTEPWRMPKESLIDLRQEKLLVGLYGFNQPYVNAQGVLVPGEVPPLLISGTELFTIQEVFGIWEEMSTGNKPVDWFDVITQDGRIEESPMSVAATEGIYLRRFDGFVGRATDSQTRNLMSGDFNLVDYLEGLISGYTELNSSISREYALYDFFFNNFGILPGNVMDSLLYTTYWTHNWCDFIYNSCFLNNHLDIVQKDETDGLFEHRSSQPAELYSIINEQVNARWSDADPELRPEEQLINAYQRDVFTFSARMSGFLLVQQCKTLVFDEPSWKNFLMLLDHKSLEEFILEIHEAQVMDALEDRFSFGAFAEEEIISNEKILLQVEQDEILRLQNQFEGFPDLFTLNEFIEGLHVELEENNQKLDALDQREQDLILENARRQEVATVLNTLSLDGRSKTDPLSKAFLENFSNSFRTRQQPRVINEADDLEFIANLDYLLSNESLERLAKEQDGLSSLKDLDPLIFDPNRLGDLGISDVINEQSRLYFQSPIYNNETGRIEFNNVIRETSVVLPQITNGPMFNYFMRDAVMRQKILDALPVIPKGPMFVVKNIQYPDSLLPPPPASYLNARQAENPAPFHVRDILSELQQDLAFYDDYERTMNEPPFVPPQEVLPENVSEIDSDSKSGLQTPVVEPRSSPNPSASQLSAPNSLSLSEDATLLRREDFPTRGEFSFPTAETSVEDEQFLDQLLEIVDFEIKEQKLRNVGDPVERIVPVQKHRRVYGEDRRFRLKRNYQLNTQTAIFKSKRHLR